MPERRAFGRLRREAAARRQGGAVRGSAVRAGAWAWRRAGCADRATVLARVERPRGCQGAAPGRRGAICRQRARRIGGGTVVQRPTAPAPAAGACPRRRLDRPAARPAGETRRADAPAPADPVALAARRHVMPARRKRMPQPPTPYKILHDLPALCAKTWDSAPPTPILPFLSLGSMAFFGAGGPSIAPPARSGMPFPRPGCRRSSFGSPAALRLLSPAARSPSPFFMARRIPAPRDPCPLLIMSTYSDSSITAISSLDADSLISAISSAVGGGERGPPSHRMRPPSLRGACDRQCSCTRARICGRGPSRSRRLRRCPRPADRARRRRRARRDGRQRPAVPRLPQAAVRSRIAKGQRWRRAGPACGLRCGRADGWRADRGSVKLRQGADSVFAVHWIAPALRRSRASHPCRFPPAAGRRRRGFACRITPA